MKKNLRKTQNDKGKIINGESAFPYCLTPSALGRFLELAPQKPRPQKITGDTLKAWGFKNSNDQTMLRVLKKLELLSASGEPTSHYVDFMKKDVGPGALGKRIKIVYDQLFQNVTIPEKANNEDLKNFFNIYSGGGERVIQYQMQTFKILATHATFGESDPLEVSGSPIQQSTENPEIEDGPLVHIDLHIHLPENKTKLDYDAIMESIANHLYGKKNG